jgi:hypothetical protein
MSSECKVSVPLPRFLKRNGKAHSRDSSTQPRNRSPKLAVVLSANSHNLLSPRTSSSKKYYQFAQWLVFGTDFCRELARIINLATYQGEVKIDI